MKRLLLMMVVVAATLSASAQRTVSGKVVDSELKEAVIQATVALLNSDSTLVANAVTNMNGQFQMTAPKNGNYILKVTYVGYKPHTRRISVSGKPLQLGTISIQPDAIMLKGATVTGQATKVTVKEDTFVYNASAYRTPEGSVVEELVKRLPGAEVSDDGTIKINGKEVKKILVDGKEFMTGDTKTAMKNLPTSIIDRIKSYDQKSDLARVSGIDDGEEETVLDFGIKQGMNKGFMSNTDIGIGTRERYSGRTFNGYMKDDMRVMMMGSANNVNDMGFPGGGGGGRFGGGRQGLTATKMLGVNMNYEKKDQLKLDGSVRWNHSDGDAFSKSSTESFMSATSSSFGNSLTQNFTRSNSWDARMRLEWMPDSMTNIMFRPQFRFNSNDGNQSSTNATYDADPYAYVTDPLLSSSIEQMALKGLMKNYRTQSGISYSDSKSVGGNVQLNRKLNSVGRNVTLRLAGNWGEGDSKSLSLSNVELFQIFNALGQDSTYQTNRYNLTPTKNWDYSARVTYSEPIMKATYLQFSYNFQYKYTKSDRSTYDFSDYSFAGQSSFYRGWNEYLNRLNNPLDSYLDESLSRFSEYKNYIHTAEVMLRLVRPAYNFNVGLQMVPQKSHFTQNYLGVYTDTTRTVTNFSPTMDFRWKKSKVGQMRFNYRANTNQPSMSDLLDITDDSDPLNIRKGNPGLKPSFTQNFRLFYNDFFQKRQQAIMTFVNFSTTANSVSNKVTYDAATGGRTTRPENINGNWNGNVGFMFNSAIDSAGVFNVNTFTNLGYNHYVGYVSVNSQADSEKSATRSTTLGERIATSYRSSWLEVELNGSINYNHSRNALQENNNLDTWQFSYGGSVNVTAPWGTQFNTSLNMNSRRGYNDASMNTNELIWNAQVSQSFLKGSPLTISLQLYDILHNQSTFSRTVNAMQRSDTEYNAITNYAMLHVIYRLNIFGGKNNRDEAPEGGFGGPGGPGGNRRGGNGGGFGGRGGFGGGGFGGPRRF